MTTTTAYRDPQFVALEEIHAAALRTLPQDVAGYLESGAGAEHTLRANREAFGRWVIRPRPLTGITTAAARSRTIELLTDELRTLMILAGTPDIPAITRATVAPRPA